MILLADYERKLVIPRWLNYAKASKTRELSYPKATPFVLNKFTQRRLVTEYLDFKNAPTPHKAADLMGAAFVIGDESIAIELAQYIKKSSGLNKPIHNLASHILGEAPYAGPSLTIREKIAQSKQFLAEFPNNALGWIERARFYTIAGQVLKADKCVQIALNLAPSDRFVVRSAARFFLHSDKIDDAWTCVKHASDIHFDPWIKATEISIAQVIKKNVKKLKGLVPTSGTPDNIFHHSELIESYGMLELINGNDHRAKKFFKLAWSNPSHNVVTHSEWIVRAHFPAMIDMAEKNFGESIEAVAWRNFHQAKIDEALTAAVEWGLEEPYARNAFSLGSCLAFQKHNYDFGIKIVKRGLEANPNDFGLQNNVCFGLLKMNKVTDAENVFLKIAPPVESASKVVYLATKGLLEYKKGQPGPGRNLYLKAIGEAQEFGNKSLLANALLNFAIAEIESNTVEAKEYASVALSFSEKIVDGFVVMSRQLLHESLAGLNKNNERLPFGEFHNPKIVELPNG